MIQCAIYPRKSKQVDNSDSMETQIDMCMSYLRDHYGKGNFNVTIYDGDYGITGHSTKNRKDFLRMMDDIKAGRIKLVLIQRYDRIARNTRDFVNLYHDMEQAGCELVSVSQQIDTTTPYGKQFMYMQASMAELEWALNSERRKDAYNYAVKQGKCLIPPHSIPFGYKAEIIDGVRRMVKDENEIQIVNDIFEHYRLYRNACACARMVNDKYNLCIENSFIRKIVKSTFYKGQYRDNLEFCEPYITVEQWNELQTKKPLIREDNNKKGEILFTGMIRCPVCNNKMRAVNKKKPNGMTYRYYHCEYHDTRKCSNKRVKSEMLLEEMLLDKIDGYMNEYKEQSRLSDVQKKKTDKSKKYKQELDRLNTMYQKGRIDDEYYDSEYLRLTALIEENEPKSDDTKRIERIENVLNEDWKEVYKSLDKLNRKLFWREIIKEIKVDENMHVIGVIFL